MPLVWCFGSIIGPMIGGGLARPCISYPDLFARGTIWDRFPYLLPNLFSACIALVSLIIGILFLDETHEDKKNRHDPGRELGRAIVRWARRLAAHLPTAGGCWRARKPSAPLLAEDHGLLSEYGTLSNDHATTDLGAIGIATADPQDPLGLVVAEPPCEPEVPAKVFTRPVVLNIIQYGILAL